MYLANRDPEHFVKANDVVQERMGGSERECT